jgi:hypothetical protein
MKIDGLIPPPESKVLFKRASDKSIPQDSGCYIITNFENSILYIGLASNLKNRFKQHLDNPEKTNPTIDGKAIWFYFKKYEIKNLPKLERSWLNQFNDVNGRRPILNKVDSPV